MSGGAAFSEVTFENLFIEHMTLYIKVHFGTPTSAPPGGPVVKTPGFPVNSRELRSCMPYNFQPQESTFYVYLPNKNFFKYTPECETGLQKSKSTVKRNMVKFGTSRIKKILKEKRQHTLEE